MDLGIELFRRRGRGGWGLRAVSHFGQGGHARAGSKPSANDRFRFRDPAGRQNHLGLPARRARPCPATEQV